MLGRAKSNLNRDKLATLVGDILELPTTPRVQNKIVDAIFTTMREALLRGEPVYIVGLGHFKLRTRPAMPHNVSSFIDRTNPIQEVRMFPPKTYVTFTPTKELRKALDHGNH